MLNLNHLRYFYITAQMKSVTRAAEFLSISQPSLSQQLTVFEDKVGFPLYYRNGRALDLTPKGKIFYEKAVSIFANVDDLTDYINKKQTPIQNLYSIAVSDEIERPFVADIVGQLVHSKISGSFKYEVISKTQFELAPEYNSGKHDLFITNRLLKRNKAIKVFDFPVNLATSMPAEVVHKLKGSSLKGMLSGLGEKLVLPSVGLTLREEHDDYLYEHQIDNSIAFESNILGCITRAVRQKVGCAFLPVPYVHDDLKNKKISILGPKKGFWQHKIYLYAKAPIESDPVSQKVMSTIQNYLHFE